MKRFLLGLTVFGMLMSSCSKDDQGGSQSSGTFRLQTLDLSDAKYLSLTNPTAGRSLSEVSSTEVGLFKIDEQGNVSTVVMSCVEEKDGTISQVHNDIKVVPTHIAVLSGIYTLLWGCDFRMDNGELFDMRAYYEPDKVGEAFNLLVRNSDGKIFYIPQAANKYILGTDHYTSVLDTDGTLYALVRVTDMSSNLSQTVIKIVLQGEELVIKQVGPDGLTIDGSDIWVLDNGTLVALNPEWLDGGYTFLYPNGGFETVSFGEEHVYLAQTTDGIKGIRLETRSGEPQAEYIVSLHDYTVGTSVGGNALSEPIALISSGTNYSTDLNDAGYVDWVSKVSAGGAMWITPLYETSDTYLLGQCLVVDKQTNQVRGLSWDESNHVIIPDGNNVYKGRVWRVWEQGAEWFNLETWEYGEVTFNFSEIGPFQSTNTCVNIPAGEMTITGVRNADGKRILCFVDIESGTVRYSVNDSNLPIVTLVPLN